MFIEDLSSKLRFVKSPEKNFTSLNGEQLSPRSPEILRDGDQLLLGELPIEVSISIE